MSSEETLARRGRTMLGIALRGTLLALWGSAIGLMALFTIPLLLLVVALCFFWVGMPLVRPTARWLRHLAGWERRRLQACDRAVAPPYRPGTPAPGTPVREIIADPSLRRDLAWLAIHATYGLIVGVVVVQLLVIAVQDLTYPLWWQHVGPEWQDVVNGWVDAESWSVAAWAPAFGLLFLAAWLVGTPWLVRLQTAPGHWFLSIRAGAELSARVAELTATRAAALDAHAVELRRIERALHDGTQNRIVGAAVLVGAARREVEREPARADEILSRAQDTIEDALAELRAVVRSILPPVLEDRGLQGALAALAADCSVPCRVVVEVPVRCPVSVETTAYFIVAEALTNVARHSEAAQVEVDVRLDGSHLLVRVTDDGRGGADPERGSGLAGIARRVEAHDGVLTVASPAGGPTEIRAELPCGS